MILSISISISISPGQGYGETARCLSLVDKYISTEDPQKTPMLGYRNIDR